MPRNLLCHVQHAPHTRFFPDMEKGCSRKRKKEGNCKGPRTKMPKIVMSVVVLFALICIGRAGNRCICQDDEFCVGALKLLEFYHCTVPGTSENCVLPNGNTDCECLTKNCSSAYNFYSKGLNGTCIQRFSEFCTDKCADMDEQQFTCGTSSSSHPFFFFIISLNVHPLVFPFLQDITACSSWPARTIAIKTTQKDPPIVRSRVGRACPTPSITHSACLFVMHPRRSEWC